VWAFDFSYAAEKPLTKASSLFIVPVLHSQQLRAVPEFVSNYVLKSVRSSALFNTKGCDKHRCSSHPFRRWSRLR
jgi:hypothetical protein